jgi:4-hydroxyacetophenone monooxygenase
MEIGVALVASGPEAASDPAFEMSGRTMTARYAEIVADKAALRSALEAADIAPLLMVQVHVSGDPSLLDEVGPHIHGPWNFMERVPVELKRKVHDRLIETLEAYATATRSAPPAPGTDLLRRMMSVCVGQSVPDEYIPLILEEVRLEDRDPRSVPWRDKPRSLGEAGVLLIGAGMSGLCMAMKLKEAGIPFTIIEKNDTVGGTWYENDYPGCGVDTPNHFFSFSFEPNHDWPHHFSKRDELWGYLERCADRHDIRRHIRFRTEVTAARYDAANASWRVTLRQADGTTEEIRTRFLISAVGQLNRPAIPAIDGLDRFDGPVFHTGAWDASVDLQGKRVAMIGTGASGMQAGPSIAGEVERLTIFQRTPHWAIHNPNYHASVSDGKKWALKHLPFYAKWYRFQLFWASADGLHASLQIDPAWPTPDLSLNETNHRFRVMLTEHITRELDGDPVLLEKAIPKYPPYGKRMLRDNHWYRMLKRPNVDLVTERIERVEPGAIVTRDGVRWPVDVIVLATGFQAGRMLWPMEITGREGRSLRDLWGDDDPRAYLGMTVPGFPNFFMLYGPNTNLGHGGSIIFHTECQVRYIMQCLREILERGAASMECRTDPHDAYNVRVDEAHQRMVWSHGGVGNWYKNARGRVIANSPWRLVDYWAMTRTLEPADYVFG